MTSVSVENRDAENTPHIFLVGAPRSGTTWLQIMLSKSDQIVSVNETHLFSSYLSSLYASWDGCQRSKRAIGLHHIFSEKEYFDAVKQFSDTVFEKVHARKPQASWILEKTPAHARCHDRILKLYPEAYFIHIIRDPRAVVASACAAAGSWGAHWASPSVVENAYGWVEDVRTGRSIRDKTDHYLEVRYEDLKEDTPRELQTMFEFMNLAVSEDECRQFAAESDIRNIGKTDSAWDLSKEPEGFFRSGKADGWKSDLTPGAISAIEAISAPLAKELGYVDEHAPTGRFNLKKQVYDQIRKQEEFWSWQKKKIARLL